MTNQVAECRMHVSLGFMGNLLRLYSQSWVHKSQTTCFVYYMYKFHVLT